MEQFELLISAHVAVTVIGLLAAFLLAYFAFYDDGQLPRKLVILNALLSLAVVITSSLILNSSILSLN